VSRRRAGVDEAAHRSAAERRQGEKIVSGGLEGVWGWSSVAGRERAARRARLLIDDAALRPGVRCLELGCGTGEFTVRLLESGCEVVAVDVSEAAVERCRERVRHRAEVVVGNVETGEGLEGREFDAIVGVSVLHHVDLDATLANTFALLRNGGRFAFSEPNLANPHVWAIMNIQSVRRRAHALPHERAFVASGLRRQLEAAGLIVDVCRPFDFLHPSTPPRLVPLVRRLGAGLEATLLRSLAGSIRVAGEKP
jgi:SAM-dependent methyltransferase